MDGVITDTAEFHFRAWKWIADDLKIEFTREFNEKLKGVSRMDSLLLLLGQGNRPHSFTQEQLEQLAARKNAIYLSMIETISPDDILPGIPELLHEIRRHGLKIGLASASRNALTVISRLGLVDQFDAIADVSKVVQNKPHPEIFLQAANLLQVEPSQCVGLEDAVAGVHAIKSAGMFAVAVGKQEDFPHADLVVDQTSKLVFEQIMSDFEASGISRV